MMRVVPLRLRCVALHHPKGRRHAPLLPACAAASAAAPQDGARPRDPDSACLDPVVDRGRPRRWGVVGTWLCSILLVHTYADVAANFPWRWTAVQSPSLGTSYQDAEDALIFGLSEGGKVYFRRLVPGSTWTVLGGSPCGGIWGVPIDVDATASAVWIVCEREYETRHGPRKEHFLFAKWGFSPDNNHLMWHMMHSGNVVQLDAEDDAMWGVDGAGSLLWRPAGNVGKYSHWERLDLPEEGLFLTALAADNNAEGTWVWCLDKQDRLWRRSPELLADNSLEAVAQWDVRDDRGLPFWPLEAGKMVDFKADEGKLWAIDDIGRLLWRTLNGTCCAEGSRVDCWCHDNSAPVLSEIADTGMQGLGMHFPVIYERSSTNSTGAWNPSSNRHISQLTVRDTGHNSARPAEKSFFFAHHCAVDDNPCSGLSQSIEDLKQRWWRSTRQDWTTWDWSQLKQEFWHCSRASQECRGPLEHFGSFRETFMKRVFCCARQQLLPEDTACISQQCIAYEMTCPGSKLLTSDMDCTVYHSHDPGALILRSYGLVQEIFEPLVKDPQMATMSVIFDANLYGTWTWIPDAVFQRFDWPPSSKALFERVADAGDDHGVWVFRKKCTCGAQQAIEMKLSGTVAGSSKGEIPDLDVRMAGTLKKFVDKFARGAYGEGTESDWEHLFNDFRAVAQLQREGYLTYATILEVVGRQQVGLPARFREDRDCMRKVSFIEQLVFIADHIQQELPDDLDELGFHGNISKLLMGTGKYFDRLLEVGYVYEKGWKSIDVTFDHESSVLVRVLRRVFGKERTSDGNWRVHPGLLDTFLTPEDVRMKACMDCAMWGNAGRHTDALRKDMGDLMRPFVKTFFTCFVPPEALVRGQPFKTAILETLQAWGAAVPLLEEPRLHAHASRR